MLAALIQLLGMDVFKIDAAGNVMERVKSIGSFALVLGLRSIVVDTDFFPTLGANCAYVQFAGLFPCQHYIYKFNIGTSDEEPELDLAAMDDLRPYTLMHLLCNYTMGIPGHLLLT